MKYYLLFITLFFAHLLLGQTSTNPPFNCDEARKRMRIPDSEVRLIDTSGRFSFDEFQCDIFRLKSKEKILITKNDFNDWAELFSKIKRKKVKQIRSVSFTDLDFENDSGCQNVSDLLLKIAGDKYNITEVVFEDCKNVSIDQVLKILREGLKELKALKIVNAVDGIDFKTDTVLSDDFGMTELRIIQTPISSENLKKLEAIFNQSGVKLQHLALDFCELEKIDTSIFNKFSELKTLSLKGNNIDSITWLPPKIRNIDLSFNIINSLPDVLRGNGTESEYKGFLETMETLQFINLDCNYFGEGDLKMLVKKLGIALKHVDKELSYLSCDCNNIEPEDFEKIVKEIEKDYLNQFRFFSGKKSFENDFKPVPPDCSICLNYRFNKYSPYGEWELIEEVETFPGEAPFKKFELTSTQFKVTEEAKQFRYEVSGNAPDAKKARGSKRNHSVRLSLKNATQNHREKSMEIAFETPENDVIFVVFKDEKNLRLESVARYRKIKK